MAMAFTTEMEVVIRSHDHEISLSSDLYNSYKNQEHVDVTLHFHDGKLLKAHKWLLCARSSYFKAMLGSAAGIHIVILPESLQFQYVQPILDFMYTGQLMLHDMRDVSHISKIAEFLGVKELVNCITKLEKNYWEFMEGSGHGQSTSSSSSGGKEKKKKFEKNGNVAGKNSRGTKTGVSGRGLGRVSVEHAAAAAEKNASQGQSTSWTATAQRIDNEVGEVVGMKVHQHQKNPSKPIRPKAMDSSLKIRRPLNAFMLYGKKWRKIFAVRYPSNSNTSISKLLGLTWKDLPKPEKDSYFEAARLAADEHKQKYPDYVYSPGEARAKKKLNAQIRQQQQQQGVQKVQINDPSEFVQVCMDADAEQQETDEEILSFNTDLEFGPQHQL